MDTPILDPNRFTTEQLLAFALGMLDVAAKEQAASRRKYKWLTANATVEAIRARVASFEGALSTKSAKEGA